MSLGEMLRSWLQRQSMALPPPPELPKAQGASPDASDIRWEKQLLMARLRRARELQIDVDLEGQTNDERNG